MQLATQQPEANLMLARYHSCSLARFLRPDPSMSLSRNAVSPTRWNRYSYALNNPLTYIDPDGRDVTVPGEAWPIVEAGMKLSSVFRLIVGMANTTRYIRATLKMVPRVSAGHAAESAPTRIRVIDEESIDGVTGERKILKWHWEYELEVRIPRGQGEKIGAAKMAHELTHPLLWLLQGYPKDKWAERGEENNANQVYDRVLFEFGDPSDDMCMQGACAAVGFDYVRVTASAHDFLVPGVAALDPGHRVAIYVDGVDRTRP